MSSSWEDVTHIRPVYCPGHIESLFLLVFVVNFISSTRLSAAVQGYPQLYKVIRSSKWFEARCLCPQTGEATLTP